MNPLFWEAKQWREAEFLFWINESLSLLGSLWRGKMDNDQSVDDYYCLRVREREQMWAVSSRVPVSNIFSCVRKWEKSSRSKLVGQRLPAKKGMDGSLEDIEKVSRSSSWGAKGSPRATWCRLGTFSFFYL